MDTDEAGGGVHKADDDVTIDGEPETACPLGAVTEVLMSRWTTAVLIALNDRGRLRFTELRAEVPGVTAKVLTHRLRQLERDGLVTRHFYAEVPPRVEYRITDLGRSAAPVFASLGNWGEAHLPAVLQARREYDAASRPRRASTVS